MPNCTAAIAKTSCSLQYSSKSSISLFKDSSGNSTGRETYLIYSSLSAIVTTFISLI